uniref:Uncharacterized protein n=1 Tax=viral metagenome TaxID=1070528 RepID=A0A6C0F9X0_9ZZZZ|tara:strand:- start:1108 stop:1467 length:360 start_codon:yes stop_codon:yes gene_type:complete
MYNHVQDWDNITLRNHKKTPSNTETECIRKPKNNYQKDIDCETNPIVRISSDFKRKIISARMNCVHNTTQKQGLTQDEFANLIKVKAVDIKLLESGKMEMKKAKQIALAIEKHLKIKIL